jgi:hypothetical protein
MIAVAAQKSSLRVHERFGDAGDSSAACLFRKSGYALSFDNVF